MLENNEKIKCIVVDDDILSLQLIKNSLSLIPFLDLRYTFENSFDALRYLNQNKVDLVITAVETKELNGIQLIKSLKNRPFVILTSFSDKYAIDGYNIDALDYILKPLAFERLLKACNKAYDVMINSEIKQAYSQQVHFFVQDSLFIKSDYKIIKIHLNDILYIEGCNDYVKIITSNSKPILSLLSLKALEEKLPSREFSRVHRSYIVSLKKINSIEKKRIKIENSFIPISQSYHNTFFRLN